MGGLRAAEPSARHGLAPLGARLRALLGTGFGARHRWDQEPQRGSAKAEQGGAERSGARLGFIGFLGFPYFLQALLEDFLGCPRFFV